MQIQLIFILIFFLNMCLIWLTVFTKKFEWYRIPGVMVFTVIPFLTVFPEQPNFHLDYFWWRIAGFVSVAMGFLLFVWALSEFKKMGIRSLDIVPDFLVFSGPYKFIRHPQYLSLILIYVGWWWIWAAVYAFYFGMAFLVLIWIEAYLEEKFILQKLFESEYKKYRKVAGMFWLK